MRRRFEIGREVRKAGSNCANGVYSRGLGHAGFTSSRTRRRPKHRTSLPSVEEAEMFRRGVRYQQMEWRKEGESPARFTHMIGQHDAAKLSNISTLSNDERHLHSR